jgi:hypothetical protein
VDEEMKNYALQIHQIPELKKPSFKKKEMLDENIIRKNDKIPTLIQNQQLLI